MCVSVLCDYGLYDGTMCQQIVTLMPRLLGSDKGISTTSGLLCKDWGKEFDRWRMGH